MAAALNIVHFSPLWSTIVVAGKHVGHLMCVHTMAICPAYSILSKPSAVRRPLFLLSEAKVVR